MYYFGQNTSGSAANLTSHNTVGASYTLTLTDTNSNNNFYLNSSAHNQAIGSYWIKYI